MSLQWGQWGKSGCGAARRIGNLRNLGDLVNLGKHLSAPSLELPKLFNLPNDSTPQSHIVTPVTRVTHPHTPVTPVAPVTLLHLLHCYSTCRAALASRPCRANRTSRGVSTNCGKIDVQILDNGFAMLYVCGGIPSHNPRGGLSTIPHKPNHNIDTNIYIYIYILIYRYMCIYTYIVSRYCSTQSSTLGYLFKQCWLSSQQ